MREFINVYTIGGASHFVKPPLPLYGGGQNRYNKGSLSAEVAELADA